MRIFLVISFFCIFHTKADPIDDLLAVVNRELPRIIARDDDLFATILRSVYNLRDTSSQIIFTGPWNATLLLSNILMEVAKTVKQKECIILGQVKWKAKVSSINSDLYSCVYNYTKLGDEIRKKIQNAYERGLKIKEELIAVRAQCTSVSLFTPANCITRAVSNLNSSFNSLLEEVQKYSVEALTVPAKVLSEAMKCNSKLLERVFRMTLDYQEMLRNCLLL